MRSAECRGPVEKAATLGGEQQQADTIVHMLNRCLALLARSAPKFTGREFCTIFDALGDQWRAKPQRVQQLNSEIMAAITTGRLDIKWQIDAASVRTRLDRSTYRERMAIGEMTMGYWQLAAAGRFPQEVIRQVRELLTPGPGSIEAPRPRRISPDLFDAAG